MKTFRWMMMFVFVFLIATMRIYAQYTVIYYPKIKTAKVDKAIVQAHIAKIIRDVDWVQYQGQRAFQPKDFLVQDDRVEFKRGDKSVIIHFSEMNNYIITVQEFGGIVLLNSKATRWEYIVDISDVASLWFKRGGAKESAISLADDLYALRYLINTDKFDKDFAKYTLMGEKYRSLKVKPPVSEEQRKFIVQAESYTLKKDYNKAIELYVQAIYFKWKRFSNI